MPGPVGLRSPGMNKGHVPFTGNIATSILYIPAQMLQFMINACKCLFCATATLIVLRFFLFFFFVFFFFFNYIRQVLTSVIPLVTV